MSDLTARIAAAKSVVLRGGRSAEWLRNNFTLEFAKVLYSWISHECECVIIAKSGFLKGSQAWRVPYDKFWGFSTGWWPWNNHEYWVYVVPRGVKINFIRDGPGGWLNWAVVGRFERGSGSHEAHLWIPNWASKPWE